MGYKNVCLDCQIAFNMQHGAIKPANCPECKRHMQLMPHRFRPPKREDSAKWKTVRFLVEHGFNYHHIFDIPTSKDMSQVTGYAQYPESMREAKEFVEKYKEQARIDLSN